MRLRMASLACMLNAVEIGAVFRDVADPLDCFVVGLLVDLEEPHVQPRRS